MMSSRTGSNGNWNACRIAYDGPFALPSALAQVGRGSDMELQAAGSSQKELGSSEEKIQLLPISTSHASLNVTAKVGSGEYGSKGGDMEDGGSSGQSVAITLGTLQKR